jgi:membrane associated rhomboid family serine protease
MSFLALCATTLLASSGVCVADIPTEAIEALGRKYEREFRKKDNKKNRQKAAREMVIEHPGGGLFFDEVIGVELNPEYQTTAAQSRLQRSQRQQSQSQTRSDHDDFIVFQQFHHQQQIQKRQQQGMELHNQLVSTYDTTFTGTRQRNVEGGLQGFHRQVLTSVAVPFLQSLTLYFRGMVQNSPATLGTSLACAIVFVLWHLFPHASWLQQYFVCSRQSAMKSHGLSILLSSVSHSSLRHLLVNLLLLFHLAPKLWSTIPATTSQKSSLSKGIHRTNYNASTSSTPLWPLILGSSIVANSVFVAIRTTKACLGLSGVVMAMMAYYYGGVMLNSTVPLQFWIGGILPLSVPPRQLIRILVGISFLGSFSTRSTIAHLVHLGGLIFGLLYFHATHQRTFVE